MFIKEKFQKKDKVISFEIFPPNRSITLKQLLDVIDELSIFRPDFISVTYGASGNSSSNYTIDIAEYIKEKYTIEAMPHLTCITSEKSKIDDIMDQLLKKDLKNVLALRGDLPKDTLKLSDSANGFKYASDLIEYINENNKSIGIAAACYPEGHVESASLEEDIENLKTKVQKGVDFLITQMFFDNDKFYNFKEKTESKNINVPITIGIMPVTNAKQIKKIVSLSGASVPTKLNNLLNKYEYDKASMFEAGIEYACSQMNELISYKVDGFHLYVMNQPETARKIYKNMNW
ncbi:MAG: methylenetetrahydrofolate reductase [NAD(P)H] [Tissierellales bacterium]|nr:methylenetetrahydrofolate reductase [NAD(P)H] [Tissierellales bacterium]MBN2826549.1 methylenetetrahydrofolate reductase [NAD(P)H] [Tissierellales bacterium]